MNENSTTTHTDIAMNLQPFLDLRRHLQIVHHVPGRIRLRVRLALLTELKQVDTGALSNVMHAVNGISDVRVNPAAGSVIVTYQPKHIDPTWWNTLIDGDEATSLSLLQRLITANPAAVTTATQI